MDPFTDGRADAARWTAAATATATSAYTLRGRVVVVAMDDGAGARAAAHVAAALSRERGAQPIVLRAFSPSPDLLPTMPPTPHGVTRRLEQERASVTDALLEAVPTATDWPVFVVAGAPSSVLATTARELDASMIAVGLHHRARLRRAWRAETVLSVLRESTVPVLATTAEMRGLPTHIVVGVDFGRAGLAAARAALSILADGGTLVLAFVELPHAPMAEATEGEAVVHAQGVVGAFARLRDELRVPDGVRVDTVVVEGTPAAALAALADRTGASVIAVGARSHGLVDRLLLGTVTRDLVHMAKHSLLIVPPRHD